MAGRSSERRVTRLSKREYTGCYRNVHFSGATAYVEAEVEDSSGKPRRIRRELKADETSALSVDGAAAQNLTEFGIDLCLLFIHPRDGDHGYTQPERAPGGRAVSGRTLQPLGPHRSMIGVDGTSLANIVERVSI